MAIRVLIRPRRLLSAAAPVNRCAEAGANDAFRENHRFPPQSNLCARLERGSLGLDGRQRACQPLRRLAETKFLWRGDRSKRPTGANGFQRLGSTFFSTDAGTPWMPATTSGVSVAL